MPAVLGVVDVDRVINFARKYPVFPCGPDKRPLVKTGFHAATQDEKQIRHWWRQWPEALVGVPTGQSTGLVVVDYDPDKATQATHQWIADHTNLLCSTRSHKTGRGGLHYLFRSTDRYQTGVDLVLDGSPRRGIDLRANGGYVIWWPFHTGDNPQDPIAPVPADLIDERRFNPKRDMAPLPASSPESWPREADRVREALTHLHPDGYEHWIRTGMALHHASGGSDEGFAVWHDWSARGETYDGIEDCRYHWASFGGYNGRAIGLGTVYAAAKVAGFNPAPKQELPPLEVYAEEAGGNAVPPEPEDAPTPTRRPMRWTELAGREPPVRTWRIAHWMSYGPMLLAGAGGIGKTLVAQTIATALALGRHFVDEVSAPAKVLFWACEDDHDELWRRQVAICRYFGVTLDSLEGRLVIEPRLGCENTLFGLAFGQPTWTGLREELREQVNDYGSDLLILDNIGQLFGCSENDRHHVTAFVNGLAGLSERPLTSMLLGHPAKAAGSEFSGSTAWENAVRMRWFLGHSLPDQPDSAAAEDGVRYLAKRKSNYSVNDWRRLTYQEGVYVPENPRAATGGYGAQSRKDDARRCVLNALAKISEAGLVSTASTASPDYLPKRMLAMKLANDFTKSELADAMNALLVSGRLRNGKVGTFANRTPRMGLIPA